MKPIHEVLFKGEPQYAFALRIFCLLILEIVFFPDFQKMCRAMRSKGLKLIWLSNVTDNLLFSQSKTERMKRNKNRLQVLLSLLKYMTLQFIFRNEWPRELIVLDAKT